MKVATGFQRSLIKLFICLGSYWEHHAKVILLSKLSVNIPETCLARRHLHPRYLLRPTNIPPFRKSSRKKRSLLKYKILPISPINPHLTLHLILTTMSLESGHYIISSTADDFKVGRYYIEDLSLMPKRVMTLSDRGRMTAVPVSASDTYSMSMYGADLHDLVDYPEGLRRQIPAQG